MGHPLYRGIPAFTVWEPGAVQLQLVFIDVRDKINKCTEEVSKVPNRMCVGIISSKSRHLKPLCNCELLAVPPPLLFEPLSPILSKQCAANVIFIAVVIKSIQPFPRQNIALGVSFCLVMDEKWVVENLNHKKKFCNSTPSQPFKRGPCFRRSPWS